MSKVDRLQLSIKRCKQDIRNLKSQYTIISTVNDTPKKRLDELVSRLKRLERELRYESRA